MRCCSSRHCSTSCPTAAAPSRTLRSPGHEQKHSTAFGAGECRQVPSAPGPIGRTRRDGRSPSLRLTASSSSSSELQLQPNTSLFADGAQASNANNSNPAAAPHVQHDVDTKLRDLQEQVDKLSALVRLQHSLLDQAQQQQQQAQQQQAQQQEQEQHKLHALSMLNREAALWNPRSSPFEAQRIGIGDRRLLGLYDARFHSTAGGATPKDFRVLPDRIFLVRHAESEGNVDNVAYTYIPDSQVPLTNKGHEQARSAGIKIRNLIEQRSPSRDYKLFVYLSPYKRSLHTYESMSSCFAPDNIMGVQEEVQLREQDFGNFQDAEGKQHEKAERLRFGRFFYRFPNGESGADVYDRITIFEDHMIRDINAGRFANKTNLVLITHGLALRVFLMRWFHWTLAQYLMVHNPPNAEPLVLERVPNMIDSKSDGSVAWMHTKVLYRLDDDSMRMLRGCTADMCRTNLMPRSSNMVANLSNMSSGSMGGF